MNTTIVKNKRIELQLLISDAFPTLSLFRKANDQQSFANSMSELLPGIRRYISSWLNHAVKANKIPAGKYKVADFVDELYIQTFDHFQEVKSSENLRSWLFKKTDELLDDTEIEEEFDAYFFKNIDNYTSSEWEEMEEKYTTDAGGDMLMIEELEDSSYRKNDYLLADVFIEDKDREIIAKLDAELSKEGVNQHIDMLANQLSISTRSIFDLAAKERFEVDEIARIKRLPIQEVIEDLTYAKQNIKIAFEVRYLRNLNDSFGS